MSTHPPSRVHPQEDTMTNQFDELVRSYHRDPFFPTFLPLAIYFALRDHVRAGITAHLNRSLFDPSRAVARDLTVRERVLLWLGF
jgi:hypothetical protein